MTYFFYNFANLIFNFIFSYKENSLSIYLYVIDYKHSITY